MSRALDDLAPEFRPRAIELLARCVEAGIAVMIVDTLRTQAEHEANLAKGVSWTRHSKHLDGLAIDIAPYDSYQLHGPDKLKWDSSDPVWGKIGEIGEKIGLKWGVWQRSARAVPEWLRRGEFVNIDLGHFELAGPLPGEIRLAAAKGPERA